MPKCEHIIKIYEDVGFYGYENLTCEDCGESITAYFTHKRETYERLKKWDKENPKTTIEDWMKSKEIDEIMKEDDS